MNGGSGLEGLRGLALPEPVSWLPATPAWIVLGVVLLAFLVRIALRWRARWGGAAYRRAALDELESLAAAVRDDGGRVEALRALPALLKRTALVAYPRREVASLSGDAWLAFLDDTLPGAEVFRTGGGARLSDCAYGSRDWVRSISPDETRALLGACRTWVRRHRAPARGAG